MLASKLQKRRAGCKLLSDFENDDDTPVVRQRPHPKALVALLATPSVNELVSPALDFVWVIDWRGRHAAPSGLGCRGAS